MTIANAGKIFQVEPLGAPGDPRADNGADSGNDREEFETRIVIGGQALVRNASGSLDDRGNLGHEVAWHLKPRGFRDIVAVDAGKDAIDQHDYAAGRKRSGIRLHIAGREPQQLRQCKWQRFQPCWSAIFSRIGPFARFSHVEAGGRL